MSSDDKIHAWLNAIAKQVSDGDECPDVYMAESAIGIAVEYSGDHEKSQAHLLQLAVDEVERLREETILLALVTRERNEYRVVIQEMQGYGSGDDPDLWASLVCERDNLQGEVKRLKTELLDTQNAVRLVIAVTDRPVMHIRWPDVSADDVEGYVARIRAQREAAAAEGGE
jgi:hypothetical protein